LIEASSSDDDEVPNCIFDKKLAVNNQQPRREIDAVLREDSGDEYYETS
jgi:hypothetical protein